VLAVANQDGGAHVDPTLSGVYAHLSRTNSMKWQYREGEVARPFEGKVELVSLRQIGHEVVRTLARVGYDG